jgi:hypothetical protein
MRWSLFKSLRPSPALVVAIVALALAAGGVAYATIPDSNGTIHGCYDSGGNLRVIDTNVGPKCPRGYTSLDWNQTGPPGPQGPTGAEGPPSTTTVEAWHLVGSPGEPPFYPSVEAQACATAATCFTNSNVTPYGEGVAFYKDPFGAVHLRGTVQYLGSGGVGSSLVVFVLPYAYWPSDQRHFFVADTSVAGQTTEAFVDTNGQVNLQVAPVNPQYYSLDGISFRAG